MIFPSHNVLHWKRNSKLHQHRNVIEILDGKNVQTSALEDFIIKIVVLGFGKKEIRRNNIAGFH